MSWTQQSGMPVMVLRYEDMRDKTQQTFSSAAAFIGLSHATDRINQALEKSSFERLKKQEQEKGFLERAAQSESFFRKGLAGSWRNVLTPEQVDRIVRTHREVMERFGYIP